MPTNCQYKLANGKASGARALSLLSGGLDSMLAVKVLQEQGIEVTSLSFKSHFFDTKKAKIAADALGIKLIEIDFSPEHLVMVKNPANGYGKNMNPCIDCHGMMLKQAKDIMEKEGFDFIATGEVLGQRPMSQNKEALIKVAKISGLENNVLRPLSAKLLGETTVEKEGKVNREELLDISGRSRERQMELAIKYGIKEYPSPAGGCLLTDPEFGQRLKNLFDNWNDSTDNDVELIKNGRNIWLENKTGNKILMIIGRDGKENENLATLAKKGDIMIELKDMVGPTTIIRLNSYKFSNIPEFIETKIPAELDLKGLKLEERKSEKEMLDIASLMTGYYSTKARGKKNNLIIKLIN